MTSGFSHPDFAAHRRCGTAMMRIPEASHLRNLLLITVLSVDVLLINLQRLRER